MWNFIELYYTVRKTHNYFHKKVISPQCHDLRCDSSSKSSLKRKPHNKKWNRIRHFYKIIHELYSGSNNHNIETGKERLVSGGTGYMILTSPMYIYIKGIALIQRLLYQMLYICTKNMVPTQRMKPPFQLISSRRQHQIFIHSKYTSNVSNET